jgi:hypothetical protein
MQEVRGKRKFKEQFQQTKVYLRDSLQLGNYMGAYNSLPHEHTTKWLKMRNVCKHLVGSTGGKRSFGRPIRRREIILKRSVKK